jgi:hypothetical protein
VQPLHHQHDHAPRFVVQPGGERVLEPAVDVRALRFGFGLLGGKRIVEDEETAVLCRKPE